MSVQLLGKAEVVKVHSVKGEFTASSKEWIISIVFQSRDGSTSEFVLPGDFSDDLTQHLRALRLIVGQFFSKTQGGVFFLDAELFGVLRQKAIILPQGWIQLLQERFL